MIDGHPPAGWDERLPVLAANPGNLSDDVGIGKMVRPASPLVFIPITDALVLAAIDLIEGNTSAAPEVTPHENLLRASTVAGLAFSLRC